MRLRWLEGELVLWKLNKLAVVGQGPPYDLKRTRRIVSRQTRMRDYPVGSKFVPRSWK